MSTKIEWVKNPDGTAGETWNPTTGCRKVSAGCENCYAERIANRFWGDRKFTDVVCHEDRLEQPLKWKKPRMIFVNSMSDLFHEDSPPAFIEKIFWVMKETPRHIYQVLTKRPERMKQLISFWNMSDDSIPNLWLGVSVENQDTADERIPLLLETPAAVRFLSCEPLLDSLNLNEIRVEGLKISYSTTARINCLAEMDDRRLFNSHNTIDWVIVGGESGQGARDMNPDWARSIREQCKEAGVPFFMKQMSRKAPIPEDLDIKEFPND